MHALDLPALGPAIEADARFPNRTNVSWYTELLGRSGGAHQGAHLRARRGGDAVLGDRRQRRCGSVRSRPGRAGRAAAGARVTVVLDGGELLVEVGEDLRVSLTGWARPVFEGRLSEQFIAELRDIA